MIASQSSETMQSPSCGRLVVGLSCFVSLSSCVSPLGVVPSSSDLARQLCCRRLAPSHQDGFVDDGSGAWLYRRDLGPGRIAGSIVGETQVVDCALGWLRDCVVGRAVEWEFVVASAMSPTDVARSDDRSWTLVVRQAYQGADFGSQSVVYVDAQGVDGAYLSLFDIVSIDVGGRDRMGVQEAAALMRIAGAQVKDNQLLDCFVYQGLCDGGGDRFVRGWRWGGLAIVGLEGRLVPVGQ